MKEGPQRVCRPLPPPTLSDVSVTQSAPCTRTLPHLAGCWRSRRPAAGDHPQGHREEGGNLTVTCWPERSATCCLLEQTPRSQESQRNNLPSYDKHYMLTNWWVTINITCYYNKTMMSLRSNLMVTPWPTYTKYMYTVEATYSEVWGTFKIALFYAAWSSWYNEFTLWYFVISRVTVIMK